MNRQPNEFERVVATCRRSLWVVAVFSFFANLLMLTIPLYMLQLFDRVIGGRSVDTLVFLTLMAIFALLVLGGLDLLRARLLARLGVWSEQRLSPAAFSGVIQASFQARSAHTRPMRDLRELRAFMTSNALLSVFDAPWMPVYIAVVFLLHPLIGWLAIAAVLVFLGLALLNEVVTRKPLAEANERSAKAQGELESIVRNSETIRAMGMGGNVIRRWSQGHHQGLGHARDAMDRGRMVLTVAKTWRMAVQIGVLGVGAYLVLQREMGPGAMIAGSILLARALAPIEGAIDSWKQAVGARAAFKRLHAFFAAVDAERPGTPLPRPKGRLSVSNVVFAYAGARVPTVRGVSFDLPAGQALAIVGPSGAGKSTLARLITGIHRPAGGVVRLDNVDVARWDREDLGPYIGYLPQDVELFDGTVGENIARMGEDDGGAVRAAAELAGVDELIRGLPQHYDTPVGERGAQLSGGQRQRVGLARALFGDPSLVVLDEPNSNLDDEGERAVQNAVARVKARGGSVVLIAHRPSMLAQVDRIMVLRNGQVADEGPRDEVLPRITKPKAVATNRPKQQQALPPGPLAAKPRRAAPGAAPG